MSRLLLALLVLASLLALFVLLRSDGAPEARGGELFLEDLGHPPLPGLARRLNEIRGFHGDLYLGFGSWEENSGPTQVIAFDPGEGVFRPAEFRAPEHAIVRYVELDGRLAVPGIDGIGPEGHVLVQEEDGWQVRVLGTDGIAHVFDLASLGGAWFAAVDGRVLASPDRGTSWSEVRNLRDGGIRHQARLTCLAAHEGQLYGFPLFAVRGGFQVLADVRGPPEAEVFDGQAWAQRDLLPPGYERCVAARTFRGALVTVSTHADPAAPAGRRSVLSRIARGEGRTVASPFQEGVRDLEAAEGRLLLLGRVEGRWTLGVTPDLEAWALWTLPSGLSPLSAWLHEGRLYVGTEDGRLHRQVASDR